MKKALVLILLTWLTTFVACGPSDKEKAEKVRQDSIAKADHIKLNELRKSDSLKRVDSLTRIEKEKNDSLTFVKLNDAKFGTIVYAIGQSPASGQNVSKIVIDKDGYIYTYCGAKKHGPSAQIINLLGKTILKFLIFNELDEFVLEKTGVVIRYELEQNGERKDKGKDKGDVYGKIINNCLYTSYPREEKHEFTGDKIIAAMCLHGAQDFSYCH